MKPRRLRLAVDARDLLVSEPTGVQRVVAQFIDKAVRSDDVDIVLLSDEALGARAPAGVEQVVVPLRRRWLQRAFDQWIVFQLPAVLRRHRIDAFYSLNTKFPLSEVPAFATVHGVEWYFYPQGYRRLERLKQWLWFQLAVRRSAGIVTFAQHTLRDVMRIHPGCDRPIRVVAEGVDPMFRPLPADARAQAVLERWGIETPFVLSVCSLEPRKNIDGLLRAYARLRERLPATPQLVLVGRSAWRAEGLKALAASLGIADRVRFTGYLPDDDLVQVYNRARVFVYPSKYEGFGLPPLEAMRCGVPVVTSDRSATGEVAAGAAVLIDPDSDADLGDGLYRALTDERLRHQLIEAGFARVPLYSWPAMAEGILGFVRETVARRRAG